MMSVAPGDPGGELLLVVNNGEESIAFKLPELAAGSGWHRRIDTSATEVPSQPDLLRCNEELEIGPRSLLLLESASTASG
jgi:hypothetical protein